MDKEYRKDGVVGFDTYWQYIKAATGAIIVAVLWMAMNAITQALQIGADWFLSYWVDLEEEERNRDRNIIIYSLLVGLFTILCFARAVTFMLGAARVCFCAHFLTHLPNIFFLQLICLYLWLMLFLSYRPRMF